MKIFALTKRRLLQASLLTSAATGFVWFLGEARAQAPTSSQTPSARVSAALQPLTGEILLEGTVSELAPDGKSFTLEASGFGLPGKPLRAIEPPKPKKVMLTGKSVAPGAPPLRVGMRVQILGPDKGSGASLVARVVSVVGAGEMPATPPFAAPNNALPKDNGAFATAGVTLTEIAIPPELVPHPGAVPLIFPTGLSADGSTVVASCKWTSVGANGQVNTINGMTYLWEKAAGIQLTDIQSPQWKAFWAVDTSKPERVKEWRAMQTAKIEAANLNQRTQMASNFPGLKVDQLFFATDVTPDGRLACGRIILLPATFRPAPPKATPKADVGWAGDRFRAMKDAGFLWRADTGYLDFDAYVKSLPAARGKVWGAPLDPKAISADGTTIACIAENPGTAEDPATDANRMMRGSRIVLVHNPAGF